MLTRVRHFLDWGIDNVQMEEVDQWMWDEVLREYGGGEILYTRTECPHQIILTYVVPRLDEDPPQSQPHAEPATQ